MFTLSQTCTSSLINVILNATQSTGSLKSLLKVSKSMQQCKSELGSAFMEDYPYSLHTFRHLK